MPPNPRAKTIPATGPTRTKGKRKATPKQTPPRVSIRRFHDCRVVSGPWIRSEMPRSPRTATAAKPTVMVIAQTKPNQVIAAPDSPRSPCLKAI